MPSLFSSEDLSFSPSLSFKVRKYAPLGDFLSGLKIRKFHPKSFWHEDDRIASRGFLQYLQEARLSLKKQLNLFFKSEQGLSHSYSSPRKFTLCQIPWTLRALHLLGNFSAFSVKGFELISPSTRGCISQSYQLTLFIRRNRKNPYSHFRHPTIFLS